MISFKTKVYVDLLSKFLFADVPIYLLKELSKLDNKKDYILSIGKVQRPRTLDENNGFWGWCGAIAEQMREFTKNEIAEAMKRMAVAEGYPTKLGPDGIEIPESSAHVSVEQMQILIAVTKRFADEHSFWLIEKIGGEYYKTMHGDPMERY